jgi:predicted lipoprotein with Yx(FWY)xxD motif
MKKLLLVSVTVLSLLISLGAYASTAVAAPPNANQPQSSAMLQSTSDSQLGSILSDQNGWILYTFSADQSGMSNCSDACAKAWPPFIVSNGVQPQASGSDVTGKLDVITRSDGTMQVTLDGKPLYYFVKDAKAGDATGNGINAFNGSWSVVKMSSSAAPMAPASGGSQ